MAALTTVSAAVASVAAQRAKGATARTWKRAKEPARRQPATATPAATTENLAIGPGNAGAGRVINMPSPGQQAHVAQDDEPTLLLVHTTVIATTVSPRSPIPIRALGDHAVALESTPAAPARQRVQLVQEKVFTMLDDERKRDSCRWIFDTGASNHMTGCRDAFFALDTSITGTVLFGDDSVERIEGCGTILFDSKNGEHRALYNTYYITRLTANIVSCSQLDKVDFEIMIGGEVMWVRDEQRRLLAKICRRPGRLYVLDLTIARSVCLTAHTGEDAWRWHARFGHTNFVALRKMGREGLVRGLPMLS